MDFLWQWTNSIGSSTDMICPTEWTFRCSTMAAKVVDFPDPVAPTISAKPLLLIAILFSMDGRTNWSMVRISDLICRITIPIPLRIRSKDWSAFVECRVPRHRWPVSAKVIAASMVSGSRISPTTMTSGAWRMAFLNASLKEWVSSPISRWLMMDFLWLWTNSIGSIVTRSPSLTRGKGVLIPWV